MRRLICYGLAASDNPRAIAYVGSTRMAPENRLAAHLWEKAKGTTKQVWFHAVKERGAQVRIVVLSDHADEVELAEAEAQWINLFSTFQGGLLNAAAVRRDPIRGVPMTVTLLATELGTKWAAQRKAQWLATKNK